MTANNIFQHFIISPGVELRSSNLVQCELPPAVVPSHLVQGIQSALRVPGEE